MIVKTRALKTHDCNDCNNSGCAGDVIRGRRGQFIRFSVCPGQVLPPVMKCTLLERASEHDGWADNLKPILQDLNLGIQEIGKYPYFRLVGNARTRK